MPTYRLQTVIMADSLLPRDGVVITPHVRDNGITSDPTGLCEDWATAVDGLLGARYQITVKAYDVADPPPSFPKAEHTVNANLSPAAGAPRELAVCLSFFADRNLPRQRGRLYVPYFALGAGGAGGRPSLATRETVALFADRLQALGGVDVDWVVWSRRDNAARPVTDFWVDDEWDTVRSRGLKSTTRTVGTTSEG